MQRLQSNTSPPINDDGRDYPIHRAAARSAAAAAADSPTADAAQTTLRIYTAHKNILL